MSTVEVIIVGAGPAGMAAAIRLARAGVRVLVLEGADYAGAENWSGCVYHADPLLRDDVLGAAMWAQAPKERRIVARSLLFHDGIAAAGFEARAHAGNDFGEAWTVLRPKLDRWLAARAIDFGATVLPATTVTGLRYSGERVVGVHTQRGNIDAEVVFIAEGDAAGLLAREGLELQPQIHYAQGIKAVFQLPAAEIEQRFGLAAGEGVAQEWILRDGELSGRALTLHATGFLYTNRESLSVGLVLPLDRLAQQGVADHPHLLQRFIKAPGIAELLGGATQVAYGAKVIRAGGLQETPVWARDGLAVGGGALGLGMEFPYPNFIGPALTSGLAFADAVVRLRTHASTYRGAEIEREYGERLRDTDDYANAALLKRWPQAIHSGQLLFNTLPALLGQLAAAPGDSAERAQQQRAFATTFAQLRKEVGQALTLAGVKAGRAPPIAVAPLKVSFLRLTHGGLQVIDSRAQPLLPALGEAFGHFYGRRARDMRVRLHFVWRGLRRASLRLARDVAGVTAAAGVGGWHLLNDLAAYKIKKIPLRDLLLRPYHRHARASQQALNWHAAARREASPTAAIAFMARREPDCRHIHLPTCIDVEVAQQLRNVCPAEVYVRLSAVGGVASQHENCIKCESCRVTVPGIDWNRSSEHRLAYRLPDDRRYGFDGSAHSLLAPPVAATPASVSTLATWQRLYLSLRARPAQVGREWHAHWRELLDAVTTPDATIPCTRLLAWLDAGRYGWIEQEVFALLHAAQALPTRTDAMRSDGAHRQLRAQAQWQGLRADYDQARLKELAQRAWTDADGAPLMQWIAAVRAVRSEAVEWLAQWSPALAWIAANHFLAESYVGKPLAAMTAPLWREADGYSQWTPAAARSYVDARGAPLRPTHVTAHGAGLDAAQPRRWEIDSTQIGLTLDGVFAELTLAIALGMARNLGARARDYAANRVQFRGDFKDREGREAVAKFGAIKTMLAGIEQTVSALELARAECASSPQQVVALIRARMGLGMDAVPWMAGQIFGGMAYSEEDILAPRYRDAFVLSQWPGSVAADDPNALDFIAPLLQRAATTATSPTAGALATFTRTRMRMPQITAHTAHSNEALAPPAPIPCGRALQWVSGQDFPYRTGSFLNGALLNRSQVLLPEHFRRDPKLRATRAQVLRLLRSGFRSPVRGESYGHFIDRVHGVPDADIARLRAFNAFATVIPAALNGKGWTKADYAVMNSLTMGRGDTSLGLLIMASTSIGTMPVLLGLQQDLPRLQRELNACLSDQKAWQGLHDTLDALIKQLVRPDPRALKAGLTDFGARAQAMFMAPGSALKYLARDYLLLLQRTVAVAKTRDLDALGAQLTLCQTQLPNLKALLLAEQSALAQRYSAHERFLRFLASGQISAFALTEPVAGSDTGGIQTYATLRAVPAQLDDDGFYRFVPHGSNAPRILLDGQRLVFEGRDVRYRLADGSIAQLDDSGWDLARNSGERRVRSGTRSFVYHDIGTVNKHDGGWVYRYWEVSGNKMWITNGAVADRYSLYAQTEFGETGLMLERRVEGLRIGPNENKLGQRASPTNELTLDRVRVSADQVIGFRGHGQVNALETLSVGRGGLVTGCATMVERVLHYYAPLWAQHPLYLRAAQFELDRLQTLAARLVGLMDGVDLSRGDFRIEAAMSKYLASEGLHRVLAWLEKIRGPMAAALEEPLEKWRRDARILNIYEGTNEVQRFLVLKDLPNLLRGFAQTQGAHVTVENLALDSALQEFREFVAPYLRALGARAWQDPDLQIRWFPAVEWAGELYVWVALYERTRVLEINADPSDRPTIRRLRATMERLDAHIVALAAHVKNEFAQNERADDPVRAILGAARAALRPQAEAIAAPILVGPFRGEWVAVVRSQTEWHAGAAAWAGWHPADIAVLDRLLAWRDAHPSATLRVAACVPPGYEDHIRRLQALEVEVLALTQPLAQDGVPALARALRARWPQANRFACGQRSGNGVDADFAVALAAALEATPLTGVESMATGARGDWIEGAQFSRHYLARARRVLLRWTLKPSGRSDTFSVSAWLHALHAPLKTVDTEGAAARVAPMPAPAAGEVPTEFTAPPALAAWLRAYFGGAAGARTETAARLQDTQASLTAPVLWIARADSLAAVRTRAALRAIGDLHQDYALLALDSARTLAPCSQYCAQARFAGLWRLPVPVIFDERALAQHLKPLLQGQCHIVFDADNGVLAAALAHALQWPLLNQVAQIAAGEATLTVDRLARTVPLPPQAVLVLAENYGGVAPTAHAAAFPLTQLPAWTPPRASLAVWRARAATPVGGLATAPVIIDVGLGVGDAQTYEALVLPLRAALLAAGASAVEIGATRKITQDTKLLPPSAQIGQTGIAVAPRILLALGVSGAPQHMSWIGKETIVIALNRDASAPIFRWQQENGAPRIVRCVGDLREWLPILIEQLRSDDGAAAAPVERRA